MGIIGGIGIPELIILVPQLIILIGIVVAIVFLCRYLATRTKREREKAPLENLERLRGLLDRGAITQEEYEHQKRKLMGE